jgi:hypothetical protein
MWLVLAVYGNNPNVYVLGQFDNLTDAAEYCAARSANSSSDWYAYTVVEG